MTRAAADAGRRVAIVALSAIAALSVGCAEDVDGRLAKLARLEAAGGPASIEAIGAAAGDPEAAVRALAIATLGRVAPEQATAAALKGLEDDAAAVRAASAGVLAVEATPAAATALARCVRRDPAWEVRGRAVEALGTGGGEEAATALREALLDPESEVRIVAARALARVDPAGSVRACRFVMRTDDAWQVRWEAAQVLVLAKTDESREALREAAAMDPNEFVRAVAARGMGR